LSKEEEAQARAAFSNLEDDSKEALAKANDKGSPLSVICAKDKADSVKTLDVAADAAAVVDDNSKAATARLQPLIF
jgi:hypothetical protein